MEGHQSRSHTTGKHCDGENNIPTVSLKEGADDQQEDVQIKEVEVAIVGGGLGGLALLVALHTRGIKAHLYEKYPGLRSDTATAIGIGPNGDYAVWILRKVDETGKLGETLVRKHGSLGDPMSKTRALQQIEDFTGWDSLRKAIQATDEKWIFERKIMDRLPLDKWSDADGQVLLIGDAAHAQYVGPGQGARTAFEDAHQLAILLEEEVKQTGFSKDSIRRAVGKFEEVRVPRLRKMQEHAAYTTDQARFQPEWVRNMSVEEKQKMGMEFMKWVEAYPNNQQGDPESTYFH